MIKIIDVTVRDGLQSHKKILSVMDRVKIVNLISSLGINNLEVGSIVSDNIIPQMKDSIKVYRNCMKVNRTLNYSMLASNFTGIKDMMANNVKNVSFFTSPSNTFNRKNINLSTEDSLNRIRFLKGNICNKAHTRGYISCVTECPYEGIVPTYKILKCINFLDTINIDDITLSDTLGTLKYKNLKEILDNLDDRLTKKLSIHLHQSDDSWKEVINLCLRYGINTFDTSLLNLGGCPAAFSEKKKKSGNLNLYDFVNYLDEIDIKHNIKKDKIREVENEVSKIISL